MTVEVRADGGGGAGKLTPQAAAARIDDWRGRDVEIVPLGGGITNHNFVVTVDGGRGGRYVMRIPGDGTDQFIDRQREHRNHVAAAATGVTPPVLYLLEPEMCSVVPFVQGETMHPHTLAGHPDRLEKVVAAVVTYQRGAVFENEVRVFDHLIRDYMRMAGEARAWLPEDWPAILRVCDEIEEATQRHEPEPVACHNDLLSENFILDGDGKMWIIDWEYGGMCDPYFDLGDFCVEHPLTRDEEQAIITQYCGELREDRLSRMLLYKIVADVWWSAWAFIQERVSRIDFDYREYGMGRVARLRANAADPDYPKWLATV